MFYFPKKEKLCNRFDIENLFAKGDRFLVYPFSIRFNIRFNSVSPKVQVLLLSPKRYQKLAVNRNRAKRLIRECYRLNKAGIIEFSKRENCDIFIAISLVSKESPVYAVVDESLKKILNTIVSNAQNHIEKDS